MLSALWNGAKNMLGSVWNTGKQFLGNVADKGMSAVGSVLKAGAKSIFPMLFPELSSGINNFMNGVDESVRRTHERIGLPYRNY